MSESDQIAASLNGFCAAWKANDGAALGEFFVDDGSLINPFGGRADGPAAVAAMYSEYFGSMLRGSTTTFDRLTVRSIEASHAFVDAEQTIAGPDGGVVLVVHLTALMRRDGNAWRFVDGRPYTFAKM